MLQNYNCLHTYLKAEGINIDKEELIFQNKSHPNYPSLLSISDTLSFFNIKNGVIKVAISELELLPDRFVAFLKNEIGLYELCLIEKSKENYFFSQNGKKGIISKEEIENKWDNIVLLVENSETENEVTNDYLKKSLPLLTTVFFIYCILQFGKTFEIKTFFIFSFIGFFLSAISLKDLFGIDGGFLQTICDNKKTGTSCTTITSSKKWKIFNYVTFSDLSIIFFLFQFIGLFLFNLRNETAIFLYIQKAVLFSSIPILIISVYYQKFVEKKWCPVCLLTALLLLAELYFLNLFSHDIVVVTKEIFFLGITCFFAVSIGWFKLKKILVAQKDLKESSVKNNRFVRNYDIFKSVLLSNPKIDVNVNNPIILGNKNGNTEITLITSPLCSFCKDAHLLIESLLDKYRDDLKVVMIIKVDIEKQTEDYKWFYRKLMQNYLIEGEEVFTSALKHWFLTKNIDDFNVKDNFQIEIEKIDEIFNSQNDWCIENSIYSTPTILINGYPYPRPYEREILEHFINDLLDDNF